MAASDPNSMIICGIGPIGARVAEIQAAQESHPAVLVDIAPAEAAGRLPATLRGTEIHSDLDAALESSPGAPVVLCTSSELDAIAPDIRRALAAGSSVVTSCEEALWPFDRHPELTRELDRLARESQRVVVGLGINPGFLMDLLPAVVAAPFGEPRSVRVTRHVDVATRRAPLQRKVGVGLTVDEFMERRATTGIGHRGLDESIRLLGAALGFRWDRVVTDVQPVVAERDYSAAENALGSEITSGGVIGMHNFGQGEAGGETRVELDLVMALGHPEPVDRVELLGDVPVRFEVPGGVPGDDGTARVLLAALPLIGAVAPGFRTVLDLPGGLRPAW